MGITLEQNFVLCFLKCHIELEITTKQENVNDGNVNFFMENDK